jgi:hypothetical protein
LQGQLKMSSKNVSREIAIAGVFLMICCRLSVEPISQRSSDD